MTEEQKTSLIQALQRFAKFLKENNDPVPATIAEQTASDLANNQLEATTFANALFEKANGNISVNAIAGYITGVFTTLYSESLQQDFNGIASENFH